MLIICTFSILFSPTTPEIPLSSCVVSQSSVSIVSAAREVDKLEVQL